MFISIFSTLHSKKISIFSNTTFKIKIKRVKMVQQKKRVVIYYNIIIFTMVLAKNNLK
jgi:hypothetical protein